MCITHTVTFTDCPHVHSYSKVIDFNPAYCPNQEVLYQGESKEDKLCPTCTEESSTMPSVAWHRAANRAATSPLDRAKAAYVEERLKEEGSTAIMPSPPKIRQWHRKDGSLYGHAQYVGVKDIPSRWIELRSETDGLVEFDWVPLSVLSPKDVQYVEKRLKEEGLRKTEKALEEEADYELPPSFVDECSDNVAVTIPFVQNKAEIDELITTAPTSTETITTTTTAPIDHPQTSNVAPTRTVPTPGGESEVLGLDFIRSYFRERGVELLPRKERLDDWELIDTDDAEEHEVSGNKADAKKALKGGLDRVNVATVLRRFWG